MNLRGDWTTRADAEESLMNTELKTVNMTTDPDQMRSENLKGALGIQRKHWEESARAAGDTAERLKKELQDAMAWAGEPEVTRCGFID